MCGRTLWWMLAAVLIGSCTESESSDDGKSGDGRGDAGLDADGTIGRDGSLPAEGPACLATGVVGEISVTNIDKVDLLFVVDDSASMAEEQASLRAEFPKLITTLTTGVRADGTIFPSARDLHLGVVSTDMGAIGIEGPPGCEGFGDDGLLQHMPSADVSGCQASYPPFLSYVANVTDESQTATGFACIAALGTSGCSFEQPLEASLKALWPSVDVNPETGEPFDPNRILFLTDEQGFGQLGHGDQQNVGFLRNDPETGLSAIAVIVVTDEEDCSSNDVRHFAPPESLDPQDPLVDQPLSLRCYHNPQNLYPLSRYLNGLKALRPGNEQLVLFTAIAGVPPDLVSPEKYAGMDWTDDSQREAFYEQVLDDARMEELVDPNPSGGEASLVPSCNTARGLAYPPRRIVEVARGFGASGSVQSICQEDLGPAIDGVIELIAKQLGAVCLPRALVRDSDGVVPGCDVVFELPPRQSAPATTPTECGAAGYEFLRERERGATTNDRGGAICTVPQLAVRGGEIMPTEVSGTVFNDGWYYDDFSGGVEFECTGDTKQRIAFTPGAKPPTGVVVKLECLSQTYADPSDETDAGPMCSAGPESARSDRVGDACLPDAVPTGGFADTEVYLATSDSDCGGGVCMVYRLRGDPNEGCTPSRRDPATGDLGTVCASPEEVENRVYCTCRCGAPEGYAECGCPSGFSCVDALDQGGDDLRGGYCVRNGTFSR